VAWRPMTGPSSSTVLTGATLLDGRVADVTMSQGLITGVDAAGAVPPPAGAAVVELSGFLLSPAAVEPHAHLDKAFLADVVTNETGDLMGAIEAMRAARDRLGIDETLARAERAARMM